MDAVDPVVSSHVNNPRIAFVVEAPAGEEEDAGRVLGLPPVPLVGPAGRLFARMLRAAGLARPDAPPADWRPELERLGLRRMLWARGDHWIGHVWPERLKDDELSSLFAGAPEAKAGEFNDPEWHARGYGWLRPPHRDALGNLGNALAVAQPDVVVTLGTGATWAFTGHASIVEARGIPARATRTLPGALIVPTLHPAHVLADYTMLGTMIGDIERAVKVGRDGLAPVPRRLVIEPSLAAMRDWWQAHGAGAALLSVDIETTRGQVSCVGFASDPTNAICVPFVDWRQPTRSYWPNLAQELEAWGIVAEWLASPVPKCLQNGLFDVSYLHGRMGLPVVNYREDTRLMQHVLNPELPKSLAFMGGTYASPPGAWKLLRHDEEKRDA